MLRIAVFASGRGSNFEALHRAIQEQHLPAEIVAVISNNSQSGALTIGRNLNIPSFHISQKQFSDSEELTKAILETVFQAKTEFIVLAGYMKKLTPAVVAQFKNKIINVHPALLPKFGGEGMFGMHVHQAVIEAKEKYSGATVHLVSEEYDRGAIILQEKVAVAPDETPETLAAKVLQIEHRLLPLAVKLFAEKKIIIENHSVHIIS